MKQTKLTPQKWAIIRKINTNINNAIHYVSDTVQYGKRDYWTDPESDDGDCE